MAILTHNLTQNGKLPYENNGADLLVLVDFSEQKGPERVGNSHLEAPTTAHNPEVAGSNPVPATRKTAVFDKKAAVFVIISGNLFLHPFG